MARRFIGGPGVNTSELVEPHVPARTSAREPLQPRSLDRRWVPLIGITAAVCHPRTSEWLLATAAPLIAQLNPLEHVALWLPPLVFAGLVVPGCQRALRGAEARRYVLAFRDAHNLFSAAASFVAALAAAAMCYRRLVAAGGKGVMYALLCAPAPPAPPGYCWLWFASKMYEWIDTILLLAAGKPLSSLHYNHHLTTATVVASHLVGRGGTRTSIFDVPMLLNAGVHAAMYAYYWRPARLRALRQLITRVQIAQHVIVLLAIGFTEVQVARLGRGASGCDVSRLGNGVSLGLFAMYLAQFIEFYCTRYLAKRR